MEWHTPIDKDGNVECLKCGKIQSQSFKACIRCCEHEHLKFVDDYDNGWTFKAVCDDCGNGELAADEIVRSYIAIKKK